MKEKRTSILKYLYNGIADVCYGLSIMFGTNNWGKSPTELSEDSNKKIIELNQKIRELDNRAWYATGQQLKNACLQIENKYGITHEQ